MQPNQDVSLVIAQNLPAILTAVTPIVASITALVIAWLSRKDSKAAKTEAAAATTTAQQANTVSKRLVGVVKPMRDNIINAHALQATTFEEDDRAKAGFAKSQVLPKFVPIPEMPEIPE